MRSKTGILVLLLGFVPLVSAHAATKTWDGSSNGNWATAANWSSGTLPNAGDDLVFPTNVTRLVTTNNFSPNRAFNSITILGVNYLIRGNTIILTNGLRTGNSTAANAVDTDMELRGSQTFYVTNQSASLLLRAANLNLNANTLTVDGLGRTEISNSISGGGSVVKAGANVLEFYGTQPNTYAGTTTVNQGRLELNKTAGVNAVAGALIIGDGLGGAQSDVVRLLAANQVANSSSVSINSSGLLDLNGNSDTIGALTLSDGAVTTGTGTLTLGGDVTVNPVTTFASISGNLSLGSVTRAFHFLGGDNSINLVISAQVLGSGGIIKDGAAGMALAGSNSFSGMVTVNAGTLFAENSFALGATSAGTLVQSNATLAVQPNVHIGLEPLTLDSMFVSGSFGSFAGGGSNSWAGNITLTHDTVIRADTTASLNLIGSIGGSGNLTKVDSGTLRFSGNNANTYSGVTTVKEGALELNKTAGVNAIAGALIIGDDLGGADADVVRLFAANQIADGSAVTINSPGLLDCSTLPPGDDETIGSLTLNGGHVSGPNGSSLIIAGALTCNGNSLSQIDGGGYLNLTAATPTINVTGDTATRTLDIKIVILAGSLTKTGVGWMRIAAPSAVINDFNVNVGTLEVAQKDGLGYSGHNTTVASGATLFLNGVSIAGESLTLNGAGVGGTAGALEVYGPGSNMVWSGSVTLASDSTINVPGGSIFTPSTSLGIMGSVSGVGGLIMEGGGFLRLAGTNANTYSGGTTINDGVLDLAKSSGIAAVPGDVVVGIGDNGSAPDLHMSGAYQIAAGHDVTINGGMFDLNGFSESIGTLNGNGTITLAPGSTLSVAPTASCTFGGTITDTGSLYKSGNGKLILTGTNSYTGTTFILTGILQVDGVQPASLVLVNDGARLQGSGTVGQIDIDGIGSIVSPGDSPGILTCSNYNADAIGTSTLVMELNGPTPGSGYDQLNVHGTVNLTGMALSASLSFASALNNEFVIINNDGSDAVVGTFDSRPEGSTFSSGGEQFRISYIGGTGNDVVLTQTSGVFHPVLLIEKPSPTSVRLLWPTNNAAGFGLQSTTNLGTTNWISVSPPAVVVGTDNIVTNTISGTQKFYRLLKP